MVSQPITEGVTVGPPLEVSPLESTKYRALTLSNELRVLIASEFSSDKAAASLNVSVGHYSDPDELPGLAHFLEHMLFLGTEKYPDEGSYNSFIAENGGHSNAYTTPEDTNYHFEMVISDRDPDHPAPRFREALDRFAQFFTAPLFTESATDRELNAVHSEHQKNLQTDARRIYQVKKCAANPAHPMSKFGTGSKETLHDTPLEKGIDTRAALLRFHKEFYSANIMTLCIIAPYPLDLLQNWVISLFSEIPNHKRKHPSDAYVDIPLFLEEQKGTIFHVQSVRDIRLLEISWFLPSYRTKYKEKPGHFITKFLGDEADGSILSLLKKRGWCDTLAAGHNDQRTYSVLVVSCTLTTEGVNYIDDIISLIYKYIKLMKEGAVNEQYYDEASVLYGNTFRFRERDDPMNFVTRFSMAMQHFPPEHYLSGEYLFKNFDADMIQEVLSYLTPKNSLTTVSGKFVDEKKTCEKERWYETMYHAEPASDEMINMWSSDKSESDLWMPKMNPFIPTELDVIGEPLKEGEVDLEGPKVVEKNDFFVLHHKLDRTFKRPNACIRICLYSPKVYLSPLDSVMGALLVRLLEDILMEFYYPAQVAGFSYRLHHNQRGLLLNVQGYSHRIDELVITIMKKLKSFNTNQTRFDMQLDAVERMYRNFDKTQPVSRALYNVSYLLQEPQWHISEYLECLEKGVITLERMDMYVKELLTNMKMVALVSGNMTEESAISMTREIQKTLGFSSLSDSQLPSTRVAQVPIGTEIFYRMASPNSDDNNSAIEVFYQTGPRGDVKHDVTLELVSDILDKPTFHELRTVQQLGYMVFEGIGDTEGVLGLYVIVQSTIADPDELMQRIDKFLVDFRSKELENMEQDKFEDYVRSLTSNKAEPDRTLGRRSSRFWKEIMSGFQMYDRDEREIEALKTVTKEDVLRLFDEYLAVGGRFRRRVVSQIYGNQHPFEKRKVVGDSAMDVTDPIAFRRQSTLYPVLGRHDAC